MNRTIDIEEVDSPYKEARSKDFNLEMDDFDEIEAQIQSEAEDEEQMQNQHLQSREIRGAQRRTEVPIGVIQEEEEPIDEQKENLYSSPKSSILIREISPLKDASSSAGGSSRQMPSRSLDEFRSRTRSPRSSPARSSMGRTFSLSPTIEEPEEVDLTSPKMINNTYAVVEEENDDLKDIPIRGSTTSERRTSDPYSIFKQKSTEPSPEKEVETYRKPLSGINNAGLYKSPERTYKSPDRASGNNYETYKSPDRASGNNFEAYKSPERTYEKSPERTSNNYETYKSPERTYESYKSPERTYKSPERTYKSPERTYDSYRSADNTDAPRNRGGYESYKPNGNTSNDNSSYKPIGKIGLSRLSRSRSPEIEKVEPRIPVKEPPFEEVVLKSHSPPLPAPRSQVYRSSSPPLRFGSNNKREESPEVQVVSPQYRSSSPPLPTANGGSQLRPESPPLPNAAGGSQFRSASPPLPSALKAGERIVEASQGIEAADALFPCNFCGRTFNQKSLERHEKICQKAQAKSQETKMKVQIAKVTPTPARKKTKIVKAEDEFQKCPHCERKFGPKPYDRHVQWCGEKSQRLQVQVKDEAALAKLAMRTKYRPSTPCKSPAPGRKISAEDDNVSVRSEGSNMPSERGFGNFVRTGSLRKSDRKMSNVSALTTKTHMKESEETNFIRATTGRGSIKRGPVQTKASQLRQQFFQAGKKSSHTTDCPTRSTNTTPVYASPSKQRIPSHVVSPSTLPRRSTAASPGPVRRSTAASPGPMSRSLYPGGGRYTGVQSSGYGRNNNIPNEMINSTSSLYSSLNYPTASNYLNSGHHGYEPSPSPFRPLFKPSAVKANPSPPHTDYDFGSSARRQRPDGGESLSPSDYHTQLSGTYDHSAEFSNAGGSGGDAYDPYQSAAKQMQDLLFGGGGDAMVGGRKKKSKNSTGSASAAAAQAQANTARVQPVYPTQRGLLDPEPSPTDLRPSTNSAFDKYIPSTADINTKMNTSNSKSLYGSLGGGGSQQQAVTAAPLTSVGLARGAAAASNLSQSTYNPGTSYFSNPMQSSPGSGSKFGSSSGTSNTGGGGGGARFCHECGNPFALPNIKFCCECGVKRLYC